MPNLRISELPTGSALTGTELVPVSQNGTTIQTTTAAISGSISLNYPFITVTQQPLLTSSRYLQVGSGLAITDGLAQGPLTINVQGALASLIASGDGILTKSGSTITPRSLAISGNGLAVSNADGTGANPTISLAGFVSQVAGISSGFGLVARTTGPGAGLVSIDGTANQISVASGDTSLGNPTISLASNAVMPGTGAMKPPVGTTAQRPGLPTDGLFRFNADTLNFEGYTSGSWQAFSLVGGVISFSGGTTGLTPGAPTSGNIVLAGILNVSNGGTGTNTLASGYLKGNGTSAITSVSTVPTSDLSGTVSNVQIANPQVTYNGITVALGASGTITAASPQALTFGTGFSAGSYDGSVATTINLANTTVTAASYGAASKTLTATVNAQGQLTALADTPIAITNTQVSGLGTMSTQNASSVAITGGSINGTTIGATTAAAGTFTNVTLTSGTISTTPVNPTDIVNKDYADSIASGLNYHQPVNYATTAVLGTYVYNNGVSGVGATITKSVPYATLSIGGGSPSVGQRVLVKNETAGNAPYNGVYTVTSVGSGATPWVLTRATDYDTSGTGSNEVDQGDYVLVISGTLASTAWVQQTALPITIGTTALSFVQFNAPITYSPGTGLNESPTYTFNIANTGVTAASYGTASQVPTIAVNAQGQITSASNTSIAIAASQVTSGTFGNSMLTNSSLTVNGVAISLGSSGTITAASPNALTIGTGLTGTSYNGSAAVTIALNTSGVLAATYGSASQVPVFAVDTYGRVTSVTNTSIAIAAGAVSGLAASATTDTTNASNISSGTLGTARLTGSYTGITGVGTLAAGVWQGTAIGVAYGGTGNTATPTNGQLLIGNGSGYTLNTLSAGTNVTISNTAGGITISATPAAGGTVTSVSASGGTTGLTFSGSPITTSGTITLGGTLVVSNGGTGATTLTGYVKGSGTSAFTASASIPNTDISGLGTMSTQNASSVAITGGTINGTTIGATTATTGTFTTVTATTGIYGGAF